MLWLSSNTYNLGTCLAQLSLGAQLMCACELELPSSCVFLPFDLDVFNVAFACEGLVVCDVIPPASESTGEKRVCEFGASFRARKKCSTASQRSRTGRASFTPRDIATTSLSHVLVLTQLCFFEIAMRGTKVEEPTAARNTPLVLLLSDLSPAKSASQKSASLQFWKLSPTYAYCCASLVV